MANYIVTKECPDFDAALTQAQMYKIEQQIQDLSPARRIAFATLTKTRSELMSGLDDEKFHDAYLEMIESVHEFNEQLERIKELTQAAHARLLIAGQVWSQANEPKQ